MFANIRSVVVENNKSRPLTHAFALGLNRWVSTEGSSKGSFCFYINRQGALADGLHGLNPRNTAHRHTPVVANSVGLATVKAHSNSGGQLGYVYKRTNPSSALGAIFVDRCMEEPGEGGLIHPRYNYV